MTTAKTHEFKATSITGQDIALTEYAGQVLLIVNVASKCGLTPQYAGLETLWRTYGERGLTVLGFPCDQFANQEPGTDAQIAEFCSANYGVTFPMFAKVLVNGEDAHPLCKWLRSQQPGLLGSEAIKWNFTKFLVARDGRVLQRFGPTESPASLTPAIEAALR